MGHTVTVGGDRLGSGNKIKTTYHDYERSTHNLSQDFLSSMAPGVLYPFMCIPAMRGDTFEIDLEAGARTIPTQGPLFGSFKLQVDIFTADVRLYQGILHNNPVAIGLKMPQVKLPTLTVTSAATAENYMKNAKFADNCLLKYLGMSGLPKPTGAISTTSREINAIPMLAYYDIFKNYYSNKQEEKAYVISPKQITVTPTLRAINFNGTQLANGEGMGLFEEGFINTIEIVGENIRPEDVGVTLRYTTMNEGSFGWNTITGMTWADIQNQSFSGEHSKRLYVELTKDIMRSAIATMESINLWDIYAVGAIFTIDTTTHTITENLSLNSFNLTNIDEMRNELLSHNTLGSAYNVNDFTKLPYKANYSTDTDGVTLNTHALNGLLVKTYQSDIYNNWVQTEWIDGENGIAELTKVAVVDGGFKIDSLNMAEKLYNVLNRVAISGNTYEDWQTAVWTESSRKFIESPIYHGGMSCEVVFEEVIQSAPAEGSPLGELGGRGILVKRKGGNVSIKCDQPTFIIGIVSLTPRICYSQGNEWYMTDLMSVDDFHKPALDGIGFQNLIGEQMAWFDTALVGAGATLTRHTIGKIPAWLHYMTAVNKAYGDFAGDANYMVLSRNYEPASGANGILDATTYIDPEKYNYAFAYKQLDAQNFWVKIESKIKARRLMSAKQIPNI